MEWFNSVVHPFPANFDGNIPEHVKRYPDWTLAVVVLAWSAAITAAIAMFVAFPIACLLGFICGRRLRSAAAVMDDPPRPA